MYHAPKFGKWFLNQRATPDLDESKAFLAGAGEWLAVAEPSEWSYWDGFGWMSRRLHTSIGSDAVADEMRRCAKMADAQIELMQRAESSLYLTNCEEAYNGESR